MKNWIRVGGRYINLDQIVDIITDEERENRRAEWVISHDDERGFRVAGYYPTEPCVVFRTIVISGGEGYSSPVEIEFFGKEREAIVKWLANDVEAEITNLNYIDW